MQTIQETFNRVIESGHYNIHDEDKRFMCSALEQAWWCDIITHSQKTLAEQAIENYLGGRGNVLLSVLNRVISDRNYSFQDCLTIYKDWANRPKLR